MSKYKHIFFDVDSTLVKIEGLDWLAERLGKGKEIARLTKKSMDGDMALEDVFSQKMEIMSPSYKDFEELGKKYLKSIVEDAIETINLLHHLGKKVWILTGNFQPAVGTLAKRLDIPKKRVITNKISFNERGEYLEFDKDGPLSRNGGKVEILENLIDDKKSVVFVGDGFTDLDTQDQVGLFVGYGGVNHRENIERTSNNYIFSASLSPLLLFVLDHQSKEAIKKSKYKDLVKKAEKLIKRGQVKKI